jgi:hypothetical protein
MMSNQERIDLIEQARRELGCIVIGDSVRIIHHFLNFILAIFKNCFSLPEMAHLLAGLQQVFQGALGLHATIL